MQSSGLTIIIPFLNEGKEIENTVASILATATTSPRIILINDASNDGYPYADSFSNQKNVTYVENKVRLGVAGCRNKGADLCKSTYLLLLDGHMRFYEKGWDKKLLAILKENPSSLISSQTRVLRKKENGHISVDDSSKLFGAFIEYSELSASWNIHDTCSHSDIIEIPCVLGAAYAVEKEYWTYIRGLDGLLSYGMDEQLLSIKVWLEGGRCLLVKNWIVGHIYRDVFPYFNPNKDIVYNKMLVAELFFPFYIKRKMFDKYRILYGDAFIESHNLLKENYQYVRSYKEYLKSIFKNKMSFFLAKNNKTKSLNPVQKTKIK